MAETSESSAYATSADGEERSPAEGRGRRHDVVPLAELPPDVIAAEVCVPAEQVIGTTGYARLTGTGRGAIDYLVRSKSVTVGRVGFGADCQLRSDARTVSRHHATIHWAADEETWAITCHSSSNALMVDGAPVLVNTPPMPLRSRVLVELGDASFFFLASVEPFVHTDDVEGLERQIEQLRATRRYEAEEAGGEVAPGGVASTWAAAAAPLQKVAAPRRARRRGDGDDESDDEYGDDEVAQIDAKNAREAREGAGDDACDDDDDDVALVGGGERQRGQQSSRRSKKRRRSSSDDVPLDDEEARRKRRREKKRRKKKKKVRRLQEDAERPHDAETEDDEEPNSYDRRGREDSDADDAEGVKGGYADDGFDSAPVPSLHGARRKAAFVANPELVRAEWNKKERADFCRAIFAVDVDKIYDGDGNLVTYDWTRFRGIAKLEKKSDAMLADFYLRMMADMESLLEEEAREKRTKGPRTKHKPGCDCVVCENTRKSRRKKEEENRDDPEDRDAGAPEAEGGAGDGGDVKEEAKPEALSQDAAGGGGDGGAEVDAEGEAGGGGEPAQLAPTVERVLGLVTAQKLRVRMGIHEAARQVDSAAGQSVMRKLRAQARNSAANGDLPSWWENGVHDHALMVGTARHGVGQWYDIWLDTHNPEWMRTRAEEGSGIEWPTTQVAMKRLREVSSAINAEIRRVAKKRARRSGDGGGSATKPMRKSRKRGTGVEDKWRSHPVGSRRSRKAGNKSSNDGTADNDGDKGDTPRDGSDAAARRHDDGRYAWDEDGEGDDDDEGDGEGDGEDEGDADGDRYEGGGGDAEEEIEIEMEEIEVEVADDESSASAEDDKVAYNTASDSGQTD